jgi:hypothetical protein
LQITIHELDIDHVVLTITVLLDTLCYSTATIRPHVFLGKHYTPHICLVRIDSTDAQVERPDSLPDKHLHTVQQLLSVIASRYLQAAEA